MNTPLKIPFESIDRTINSLRSKKIPFRVENGSNTTYIKGLYDYDFIRYISSSNYLSDEGLSLIRSVKASATHCKHPNTGVGLGMIKLTNNYKGFVGDRRKDICEVDLSRAYWEAALKLGFISKKVYKKAEQAEKKHRLIALGALASQYDVYISEKGEEPKFSHVKRNDRLRSYFFSCCLEIELIMKEIRRELKEYVHSYWVDAVFVDKKLVGATQRIIASYGYSSKVVDLGCYHTLTYKGQWRLYATEKDSGRVKYFCL